MLMLRSPCCLLLLLITTVGSVGAQPSDASLDARLLYDVYGIEHPAVAGYLSAIDATAYPVFLGIPVAAWGGAWLIRGGGDWTDAYRLTLTGGVAGATTIGLKYLIRRQRPFAVLPGIAARNERETAAREVLGPYAFPSGHTSLAFALATSWSLSHPEWYVIVPSAVWATSVGISRVWLGVHYPTDVLSGALLGGAVATGVHLLGTHLTPGFLKDDEAAPSAPVLHLRFRL